jgi:hypothetical protein
MSVDEAFPSQCPIDDAFWNSVAIIGISSAFATNSHAPKIDTLYAQTSPSFKVIANKCIQKDGLVLVAYSNSVKKPKEEHDSTLEYNVQLNDDITFQMVKPDPKKFDVPYWRVRRVDDETHSNMVIELINRNVSVPIIKGVSVASPTIVKVPSAVLKKDVRPGDELVLYVPPKPKTVKEKRSIPIAFAPVKSAKIS